MGNPDFRLLICANPIPLTNCLCLLAGTDHVDELMRGDINAGQKADAGGRSSLESLVMPVEGACLAVLKVLRDSDTGAF
jgi:hypothetical protein